MELKTETLAELLQAPQKFAREQSKAFLYAPYSRKLQRRLYCYTHLAYDLWTYLEIDSSINRFNERVPKIPISYDGAIKYFKPVYFIQKRDASYEAHLIRRSGLTEFESEGESTEISSEEQDDEALANWSRKNQCRVITWTAKSLRANPVLLANQKRLLRYLCTADRVVPLEITDRLGAVLHQYRKLTVHHLIQSLPDIDEQWVITEIARLILEGLCYSDTDRYPFHYSTELSVFHAFA